MKSRAACVSAGMQHIQVAWGAYPKALQPVFARLRPAEHKEKFCNQIPTETPKSPA